MRPLLTSLCEADQKAFVAERSLRRKYRTTSKQQHKRTVATLAKAWGIDANAIRDAVLTPEPPSANLTTAKDIKDFLDYHAELMDDLAKGKKL